MVKARIDSVIPAGNDGFVKKKRLKLGVIFVRGFRHTSTFAKKGAFKCVGTFQQWLWKT